MIAVTTFAPAEILSRSERILGSGDLAKAASAPDWVLVAPLKIPRREVRRGASLSKITARQSSPGEKTTALFPCRWITSEPFLPKGAELASPAGRLQLRPTASRLSGPFPPGKKK